MKTNLLDLIRKILEFITPIIIKLIGGEEKKIDPPVIMNKSDIFNKSGLRKGIEYLQDNRRAFLYGKNTWEGDGHTYNSCLYCEDMEEHYYKVKRYLKQGIIKFKSEVRINKSDIPSFGWQQTYCNYAASCIYNAFTAGKINTFDTTIQTKMIKGKHWSQWPQFNGNKVAKNVINGVYNKNDCGFVEDEKRNCEEYAIKGGYSIGTYFNPFGRGHIATIIDIETVFQAGKDFGIVSIMRAFGMENQEKIKYYRWVKL